MLRAQFLFFVSLSLIVLGTSAQSESHRKDRTLSQTTDFTPQKTLQDGRPVERFTRVQTRARRDGLWNGRVYRRRRQRRRFDSFSVKRLRGVLQIRVVGTGDACLVTIIDRRFSYKRQFGDTTSTSAFIDMYGLGICEEGAVGKAYGMVQASVIAKAYQRGEDCLASVVTEVLVKVHDPDPDDGVYIENIGGVANGTALAVCKKEDAP